MELPTLNLQQARNLALAAQGLLDGVKTPATKYDLLSTIRRIHALQIDTINVVARAPYHILWSRLGSYEPAWLDELHAENHLFEYWAHAACFLPIEDYPIYRRVMLDDRVGWDNIKQWGGENKQILDQVMDHICQHGAVKSSDFERQKNGGGWWNWKVEKVALEYLFTKGDLMITRRDKFQRVYDLQKRVLPDWTDENALSYAEAIKTQILRTVKALGVAREEWVAPYFYLTKGEVLRLLPELAASGELRQISIEGMNGKATYIHPDNWKLFQKALNGEITPDRTTLLSPFDPLINDRARTKALFNFDYSIECYTPAPKRVYGYFVLPILHCGQLIGRLDAKAYRKEKRLEIKKLFIEPEQLITDDLVKDLKHTLSEFAHWQKLDQVEVCWSDPPELAAMLA